MNWSRWEFTLDRNIPPWATDQRHVEMLEAVVRLGKFESAAEIGLLLGRATTAFVEAKEAGAPLKWVMLCDVKPTKELLKVSEALVATGCTVAPFWKKSVELMDAEMTAKLWVIDGDHSLEGVMTDLLVALRHGAEAVVIHDTRNKLFPGVQMAGAMTRFLFPFYFEDAKQRFGEETERGWFFASLYNHPELFARLEEMTK
jgi:hypothetical protein